MVGAPLGGLAALAGRGPVVDGGAGDGDDIIAGLLRHAAGAGEPILHPARTCVVGRGGQTEIAELVTQFAQKLGRFRQRLHGIKRIEQAALARGARHELRDALRALAAARHRPHRIGLKAAFLPDHAGKELDRQVVRPRRRLDHQAHRLAGAGVAGILAFDVGDREFFDARMDHPRVGGSRCILRDRQGARPPQHHDGSAEHRSQTDQRSRRHIPFPWSRIRAVLSYFAIMARRWAGPAQPNARIGPIAPVIGLR